MTTIIRGQRPERGWTDFDNKVLRDSRISFRALGVLVRLLSNASGFSMSSDDLSGEGSGREGRDAVQKALSELVKAGYVLRKKHQDSRGRWRTNVYVFDTHQHDTGEADLTETGFSGVGYDVSQNVSPTPEKPAVGSPGVGFSGVIEKDQENNQQNITHPAPCAGTPMAHAPWGGCLAFLKASGLSSGRANLAHKLLSEMSLQGGGKLEECDWEDILQNLASGGVDDSIAWLKSISRNGWRRGKLKDIARPGETVQQVKTRVSAQSGKLNEEGRLNEAVNEDKAIEFACLRPGGFKSFVSSSFVLKSMINGWEGERDKFPHGLKKEAMEFYMLNAKQAIA